ILSVRIIREIILKGIVASRKDPQTPMIGADVSIFTVNGDQLTLVANLTTESMEPFTVPLEPDTKYQITVTKPGYWGSDEIIDLTQMNVEDTIVKTFFLEEIQKIKLRIKRVHFAFDKYNIIKEYKPSLDSLYTVLTENPDFTLEIVGHTDEIGSEAYNMQLA